MKLCLRSSNTKSASSDLLNADEVKIASHRTEQAFRKHMLSVPDAFVSWLKHHIREYGAAPTEHEVHVTLMTEIRAALERFCDEMRRPAA